MRGEVSTFDEEENEIEYLDKYYHFILNALDNEGHKQIRELSSRAWDRAYTYKGLMRRPTYYSDLEEVIGNNKGHIVGSSACLGGVIPHLILDWKLNNNQESCEKLQNIIQWFDNVFGHGYFFLEIQPCLEVNKEQIIVNKTLWEIGQFYDIKVIATTDAHFLNKEQAFAHKVLLNSKDGGETRETEEFYATTYLMDEKELRCYLLSTFTEEQINTIFANTNSIADMVIGYDFEHAPMIPQIPSDKIPQFEIEHRYKEYYEKYEDFGFYANIDQHSDLYKCVGDDLRDLISKDQYFYYRIEKALYNLVETQGKDIETYIARLNNEFHELRLISEAFNDSMASYYTTMSKIIELIWEADSLSMPARGSGAGFLVCYLLDITQIDPVPLGDYFPFWRHLSAERGVEIADIDNDSQNAKRDSIINALKEYFGYDRVLNVATFSTLSGKTAVEKAGKGLSKLGYSISDETIGYLRSLVPTERGQVWSLKDCFYGNEEKGRVRVTEFVNEVSKYEYLEECMFAFEGLIINRGIHASGILIGNEPYVNQISAMRSPNGVLCSCYDLHDAEYCGWTKVDILTIQASDKIRKTMDMLIEHGHMEWQGNLKDTYWKYLHPDVLDYDTEEMWDMIKEIYSIFQFDTQVAVKALNQVEPHSVMDLSATNSLLRLQGDGEESPLDRYARYKTDINEWYKDMTAYGLNKEEQQVLIEHLDNSYGMAESQEKVMLLSMDKRVSGFSLKQANKLRKAIAKKKADVLEETKELFYNSCKEQGTRDIFAKYIWEEEFGMSFGYSFSQLHSYSYSVIALQELNLNYYYPRVYWNTACLTVESQSDDTNERAKGQTDYGKIAKAIYKMKKFNVEVLPPNINKSDISFTPNEEDNTILFGLGGISGINLDIAQQIIDKRPYTDFDDFYNKHHYKGSLITKSKFITLIKSGCFDNTDDKITAMQWLTVYENPKKESLTMSNVNNALNLGVDFSQDLTLAFYFKKYVLDKNNFYCNDSNFKSKKHYLIPNDALEYFENNCIDNMQEEVDYYYTNEGTVVVDKALEKALKPKLDKLSEMLKDQNVVDEYNRLNWQNEYNNMIGGIEDVNKWSFESICFYPNGQHELQNIDFDAYNISKFSDLPEEPRFIERQFKNGRTWKQYEISRICGVVLDRKDKDHFFNILTPDNEVVAVNIPKGQFAYYKQNIEIDGVKDDNWLKRGNLIMVCGYRREDAFFGKNYKSTIYQHSMTLIEKVNEDGSLDLRLERLGAEN
ncbi:MAG: DNA polymerase III subunit alpha [Bacteroidales bacterium]|nr:DNA polymerase III subunit alpha [Candidatus Scybalousia scybalohippi]